MKTNRLALITALTISVSLLSACNSAQYQSQLDAQRRAESRSAYVPKDSLDFINYDKRQRISDNPSTIVWCTAAFNQPGIPLITVPIVGKLTSGGKRPFATDPGPDGMYGSSGDYRYGFTPGGVMVDFSGIPTFCTTEPTVWQREKTQIVVETASELSQASKQAEAHVAAGRGAQADAAIVAALKGQ